ncbi:alpha/beta fold hydrolase [Amycolatopsis thermoflava]|uniref:alpha/beta fold hydrolase n=1 Tax=Amycolatopsis thermoflava TaxID=84480 RepID=UPI00380C9E07
MECQGEEGVPPVVVLIHGGGMDRRAWAHVIARLPRDVEVVAPDLPGHGSARAISYRADVVGDLAEHVIGSLDVGISKPVVVGHSLGAAVALAIAQRIPVAR